MIKFARRSIRKKSHKCRSIRLGPGLEHDKRLEAAFDSRLPKNLYIYKNGHTDVCFFVCWYVEVEG